MLGLEAKMAYGLRKKLSAFRNINLGKQRLIASGTRNGTRMALEMALETDFISLPFGSPFTNVT